MLTELYDLRIKLRHIDKQIARLQREKTTLINEFVPEEDRQTDWFLAGYFSEEEMMESPLLQQWREE